MVTVLAILGVITALAPVLFKILSMRAVSEAAKHVKENALATTEVDELDTSLAAVDQRLRGDSPLHL